MQPHAVKVPVIVSVPIECEFWSEDDGWTGSYPQLTITVHGNNFENTKRNMEAALQAKLESILRSHSGSNAAA
jgi:predicted RNase H-like HicB family nuclease